MLQTFHGLGRGKGFSVTSRESGIDDPDLARAVKPKLLELVAAFAVHGHTSTDEILSAAGMDIAPARTESSASHDQKIATLESHLAAETRTRAFLEREVTELQLGLRRAVTRLREDKRRASSAERRLEELRRARERLVVATRDGVTSLQDLRRAMQSSSGVDEALADHVRRTRAIVEAVQTLRIPEPVAKREHRPG